MPRRSRAARFPRMLASIALCSLLPGLAVGNESTEGPASIAPEAEPLAHPEQPALDLGAPDSPLRVRTHVGDGRIEGEVWSVADAPFHELARALEQPARWCDIVTLHLNIKSCLHETRSDGRRFIHIFMGTREYQPPEEANRLVYEFRLTRVGDEQLEARFESPDGPFGTFEHRLWLSLTPLSAERSLVHFRYGNGFHWAAETAVRWYLRTWARKRVGFSEAGDPPRPIRGLEGLIERNAARYHLAIQAFLDEPDEEARERRWARWHQLTEQYPQLHEVPRKDYLAAKAREHADRRRLQALFAAPAQAPARPQRTDR